jgi:predicted RNA-binding Zn-ribbon protein involved in translation (DUF1610 family)
MSDERGIEWQAAEKEGAHVCPNCGEVMKVTATAHMGKYTIRYIRCPICGRKASTCESIRNTTYSV